jgi:protein translocase SEC61 complex gamma subunit
MSILSSVKSFISQCGIVWTITKKPTSEEFKMVAKASAIGVLVIGLLGFLIAVIVTGIVPI